MKRFLRGLYMTRYLRVLERERACESYLSYVNPRDEGATELLRKLRERRKHLALRVINLTYPKKER